jgi:hypothetical protein
MPMALAAPTEDADENAAMVGQLHLDLARSFHLPKDLKLDPALRAEAEKIAASHLERMKVLLPGWVEEEKALQAKTGKPTSNAVFIATWARVLNELALWQVEPGDSAYEQATLEAIKATPAVCDNPEDQRFQDFSSRMLRVQAMPPAQRQPALATERRLLEHWGKPRAAVPPWPDPLAQDAAMAALAKVQAGGPPPPRALPPFLASYLLAERKSYDKLTWNSRCAVQQWWLRVSLAEGAAPAAALNAFRYGTLISATDRFGLQFETTAEDSAPASSSDKPPYPKLAARFDVTGSTVITRSFDAAGKPVRARVTGREIKVRGIRGTRPVAFENTFDALSVRHGMQGNAAAPGASAPPVFKMVWSLDE